MTAGITELIESIKDVPEHLDQCDEARDDLKELKQWTRIYVGPEHVARRIEYNIEFNFGRLLIDLAKVRKYHSGQDYEMLGQTIGEMIVMLTRPEAVMYLN